VDYDLLIAGAGPTGIYKGIHAVSEGKISVSDGSKQQTLDFLGETISRWGLNCPILPPRKA
jgi:hypothetical protein